MDYILCKTVHYEHERGSYKAGKNLLIPASNIRIIEPVDGIFRFTLNGNEIPGSLLVGDFAIFAGEQVGLDLFNWDWRK